MVVAQIECVGRDVGNRSFRTSASRCRLVFIQYLKQVRRRPEEIFAGICALIVDARILRDCTSRAQHHGSEKISTEKTAGNHGSDMQLSRFRFFMEEFRSRRCNAFVPSNINSRIHEHTKIAARAADGVNYSLKVTRNQENGQ